MYSSTKKQKKKSSRQLINSASISDYSLRTYTDEIVYFILKPTNISVLSQESIRAKINNLMNVCKGITEIEMLCMDSRESLENNKQYLRRREAAEDVPQIRALLSKDIRYLDLIQVQMATAREFLLLIRLDSNRKKQEVYPYLNRIERLMREQGFAVRRADADDIKRILAIYFEANTTTESFENYDGERWISVPISS